MVIKLIDCMLMNLVSNTLLVVIIINNDGTLNFQYIAIIEDKNYNTGYPESVIHELHCSLVMEVNAACTTTDRGAPDCSKRSCLFK